MKILKTIKLFIDGQFVRSESGRSFPVNFYDSNKHYAHLCLASKKDFRGAVEAAKKGNDSWSSKTAYNRGQILYRMAEMCEGKRYEFLGLYKDLLGYSHDAANDEIDKAIDAFVFYAGFTDKYQQLIGTVNPVSSPHHNFTTPEGVGVTVLVASDEFKLSSLVDQICSILCSGNSLIVLMGKQCPAMLSPLSEIFATSDLPAGVVNLLSGDLKELYKTFAEHMEINCISYQNEDEHLFREMKELGVDNMKRLVGKNSKRESLDSILNYVEYKTVWHPIGI